LPCRTFTLFHVATGAGPSRLITECTVSAFAKSHGWILRHYKDGFMAIFTKEPPSKRN